MIARFRSMQEAKKHWAEAIAIDLHESGHEYSGSIGMLGPELPGFPDHKLARIAARESIAQQEQRAEEWLAENQEKWGRAKVVELLNGHIILGGWCSS